MILRAEHRAARHAGGWMYDELGSRTGDQHRDRVDDFRDQIRALLAANGDDTSATHHADGGLDDDWLQLRPVSDQVRSTEGSVATLGNGSGGEAQATEQPGGLVGSGSGSEPLTLPFATADDAGITPAAASTANAAHVEDVDSFLDRLLGASNDPDALAAAEDEEPVAGPVEVPPLFGAVLDDVGPESLAPSVESSVRGPVESDFDLPPDASEELLELPPPQRPPRPTGGRDWARRQRRRRLLWSVVAFLALAGPATWAIATADSPVTIEPVVATTKPAATPTTAPTTTTTVAPAPPPTEPPPTEAPTTT
ncbi:MAG: hypothetical protein ACRD0G_03445, partial [Acidimicrobiales bacterium]